MQKSKKIVSLFFLTLFSVLMLHQVVPHVHHHHGEVAAHLEQDHHHHHNGQEHQHEGQNEEDDKDGLLGLLLGSHAHSVQFNEVQFIRNTQKQGNEVKQLASLVLEFKQLSFPGSEAIATNLFRPKNEYPPSRHYLESNALRGPPTLV